MVGFFNIFDKFDILNKFNECDRVALEMNDI